MHKPLPCSVISSLFLLLLSSPVTSQTAPANEPISRVKPSVVRIIAGCTAKFRYTETFKDSNNNTIIKTVEDDPIEAVSGSGFFINSDGYIVTNAHVVSTAEDGGKACRERLFSRFIEKVTSSKLSEVSQNTKDEIKKKTESTFIDIQHVILFNESGSNRFKFDLKKIGKPINPEGTEGKDVAVIKIALINTPALLLENSDTVQYQDKVAAIGFPAAADLSKEWYTEEIFDAKNRAEASVMDNTIANPNKTLSDGTPVIQLNQAVPKGTSGGPVLIDKRGELRVIGIATFRNVDQEDKVAFAMPTSVIKEFLGQAGATNEVGTVGQLYKKGLEFYSQGKYQEAKIKFEAVKGLFKYHSEIDRLIRDCNQKLAEQAVSPPYLFWGAIAGFTSLVFVLAYLLFRQSPGKQQLSSVPVGINFPDVSQPKRDHKGWGSVAKTTSGLFRPTVVSNLYKIHLKNVQGRKLSLSLNQLEHRLGRDATWSNFKLPSEGWGVISRKQAVFRKKGDTYYLYDGDGHGAESSNRIYLNEIVISPTTGLALKDGMELRIGNDPSNCVILTYSSSAGQDSDDQTDVSRV